MTRAEHFAQCRGLREGEPHQENDHDESFWAEGDLRIAFPTEGAAGPPMDDDFNFTEHATLENCFDIVVKDTRDTPLAGNPIYIVRWEFEDGSAIIFQRRDWSFGLSEDELNDADIQRRFAACPDSVIPIMFADRKTILTSA